MTNGRRAISVGQQARSWYMSRRPRQGQQQQQLGTKGLGNSRSTEDETDSRFGAVNYSPHCIPIFLSFFLLFAFLPSFLGG